VVVDQPSALDEVLHGLRLADTCYCRTSLSAPWGLDQSASPGVVTFHFIASGPCWLRLHGETLELAPGDLVLFPRGAAHRLLGAPDVPDAALLALPIGDEPASEITHGGGGEPSLVLCGGASFETPEPTLVALLPDVLTVRASEDEEGWVGSTLRLMRLEAERPRPGGQTMIARLSDILVVHALRVWLAGPDADRGWLGALRDHWLGPALLAVHEMPEEPWTVESLAAKAHLSRAAFAERFTRLVGTPPMSYVRERRMRRASERLLAGEAVGAVARRSGYGSVAAFSRAFKQVTGEPPSRRAVTR
jgi:AraC-like DNA-binding protein